MANTDKNIVITPNIGSSTADPKVVFSGADASTAAQSITLNVYPTNGGTLSFEGSAGQLFSIANSMSGTIFSANDVSGIPSIEVLDSGVIKLGQYSGNVLLGTATDNGSKLQVNGRASVNSVASGQQSITVSSGTTNLDLGAYDHFCLTMNASTTFTITNAAYKIGGAGNIIIKQDGSGGRTFTKSAEMKTPLGGATIVQNTTANTTSLLCYYVVDASTLLVNYIANFA